VKNLALASIAVISILIFACDSSKKENTSKNLVCQLVAKENKTCTAVLSLDSGEIRFNQENHSFVLTAHYNACFQADDVVVSGEFVSHSYASVLDLELLAKKTETKNSATDNFPRTIGILTLSKATLQGRFVDVWSVIRTHTKPNEKLPLTTARCMGKLEVLGYVR